MNRDEAIGNHHNPKQLIKACDNGYLYDYVAQWYYQMSKEELKEVVLSMLGVISDNNSEEAYESFQKKVVDELGERNYGED